MTLEEELQQVADDMVADAEAVLRASELERHSLPMSPFPNRAVDSPGEEAAIELRWDNLRLLYYLALHVRDGTAAGSADLVNQLNRVKKLFNL